MFICTIHRYYKGESRRFEIQIPLVSTITGNENQFAIAYDKAEVALQALRELDTINGHVEEYGDIERKKLLSSAPRYSIDSLVRR
jgi:hypothetical protein